MSKPSHITVRSRRNDSNERVIKRFIRKVKKAKIIDLYKETLRYKKPSEEKNEKRRRKLKQIEREKSKQATNYKERKK